MPASTWSLVPQEESYLRSDEDRRKIADVIRPSKHHHEAALKIE